MSDENAARVAPVEQAILGPPNGDCFRACIASLLHRELTEVPNYHGFNWWNRYVAWGRRHGLEFVWYEDAADVPDGLLWIAAPVSPRNQEILHSVVALGDRIVWDPYPGVGSASRCDLSTTDGAIVVRAAGDAL